MISSTLLLSVLIQGSAGQLPTQISESPGSFDQLVVLDSVRLEMERGRAWHASRLLRKAFPSGPEGSPELVLLFAEAEAGWGHWSGVLECLEEGPEDGSDRVSELSYLLGRALEETGRLEEAEKAYLRYFSTREADQSGRGVESETRRVLLLGRLGRYSEALIAAGQLAQRDSAVADWVALRIAEAAAGLGMKEETRLALSMIRNQEVRALGWSFLPLALLASGDSIGAEAAFWSALPSLPSSSEQKTAWAWVGDLRLARGDSTGAQGAFYQVLAISGSGPEGVRAARALTTLGFDSVDAALAGAQALAGASQHQEALEVFSIYEGLSDEPLPPGVELAKARSHLRLGQGGRALSSVTSVGMSEDPEVGGPALSLKVQALRQLGRGAEARAVQDELVRRFPSRPESVEILFSRADALQDQGDREGAIRGYRNAVAVAPAQNLAGLARMRMGQLLLGMGRSEEALEVYSDYLADFPDGRRWDEASFWGARILFELGRVGEGEMLLDRLRNDHPLSYYSVLAGELLDEPFEPPILNAPEPLPLPAFFEAGLARVDRFQLVGLEAAVTREIRALVARAREVPESSRRQGVLLRLAHELNARGFTRDGINLGWDVRREGRPWDRSLLAAIYPFPHREVVLAEARDRGVDPFLMAGLIRQESAFLVEVRSAADARGLMQVLPSTGRELARSAGVSGFDPDRHLFNPEINIHLGTAFFVDMRRRFGDHLPIILSAYNAGPTRANRWRKYPEAGDWPLFVEKIPFDETRGYVKNVTANHAIYGWLYGPGHSSDGGEGSSGSFLDAPFTPPASSSLF